MKNLMFIGALVTTQSALAAQFDCYTFNDGPVPRITLKVGDASTSGGAAGAGASASYPVTVQVRNEAPTHYLASGSTSEASVDLNLLFEGDIVVGSLQAKSTGQGFFSGHLWLEGVTEENGVEMDCRIR